MLLGLSGLIPFGLGVILVASWRWASIDPETARLFLLAYGAVILSFLGGVRWGLVAGRDRPHFLVIGLSVVPSLAGLGIMFVPGSFAYLLFAAAFAAQGAWDIRTSEEDGAASWYPRLRLLLTMVVVAFFLLAFILAPSE